MADNGLIHDELLALFGEIFRGESRVPIPGIPSGMGLQDRRP